MANDRRLDELEHRVGHPDKLFTTLRDRIPKEGIRRFAAIQQDWLDLMWCLDQYRVAQLAPTGMGKQEVEESRRLAAIYRGKGHWFAELLALLLHERTRQEVRPRSNVRGFSQVHQIDCAWPARDEDVRVCAEVKVTGAPAHGKTPARRAIADYANRRKELKFAAADLKLYRRDQKTTIREWGSWRRKAPPRTYFLWGARLVTERKRGNDRVDQLVAEAAALVSTYMDGAGLIAWRAKPDGPGYEIVPIPRHSRVQSLDNVLRKIESDIRRLLTEHGGEIPAPVTPDDKTIDVEILLPDPDPHQRDE